ncbi:hypothetical protein BDV97DRAFT_365187 [Delphinella strobiligena]|nr:hypothetical protein BDV97DRAFT_365187 [Delphinella strobiligena]
MIICCLKRYPTLSEQREAVYSDTLSYEHIANSLFSDTFTTPFVNHTNVVNFDIPASDRRPSRLTNIASRVQQMDRKHKREHNRLRIPRHPGNFNTSFATAASYVNDERRGRTTAAITRANSGSEMRRELGGVWAFVGGYTNTDLRIMWSTDDTVNEPMQKVVQLDVPIYLHSRTPPPGQHGRCGFTGRTTFMLRRRGYVILGVLLDTLRGTGVDRVMFSVDYPFEDDVEIASWFDRLELIGNTKKKLAY